MDKKSDDFYVGYIGKSQQLRNFYQTLVPLIVLLVLGALFWILSSQENSAGGFWDVDRPIKLTGKLVTKPYPTLITQHQSEHGFRSVMIVGEGKDAASAWAKPFDAMHVSITGNLIHAGGWELLEISSPDSIEVTQSSSTSVLPVKQPLSQVSIKGEIVDSKCFLGVMRPGEGKVHKACAGLCLMGGMPPILVVKNDSGQRAGYLLTTHENTSASRIVVPYVAEPVEVMGNVERYGDLLRLKILPNSIRRLSSEEKNNYGELLTYDADVPFICQAPLPG